MPPLFGTILSDLLGRRKLSQRAFAIRVGVTPSYISRLVRGQRAAPDEPAVLRWSDELTLSGVERETFLLAADLSRTAPRVVALIKDIEAKSS